MITSLSRHQNYDEHNHNKVCTLRIILGITFGFEAPNIGKYFGSFYVRWICVFCMPFDFKTSCER